MRIQRLAHSGLLTFVLGTAGAFSALIACSSDSDGGSSTTGGTGGTATSAGGTSGAASGGTGGTTANGGSAGSGGSSGASSGAGGSGGSVGGTTGGTGTSAGGTSGGAGGTSGGAGGGGGASGATSGGASAGGGAGGTGGSAGAGGGGGNAFDPCPATGDCKLLPLGDSITFGTPGNNGGYRVKLFANAVTNGQHITFVGGQSNGPNTVEGAPFPKANEGHPGWTIQQIDAASTSSQALAGAPHIVLLHIGTNDITSNLSGAPDRLAQLVDKLVAALPNSLIAVASIIPIPFATSSVSAYNSAIPGIVEARADAGKHVIYVEMFQGFPGNGLLSDNVHPNENVGYPWMGDTWYEAIQSYLH